MAVAPLDMAQVVAEALGRVEEMASDASAIITKPDVWPTVLGYAPWIEEVWVNYMSNAIRYGGSPPRIELGATPEPVGGFDDAGGAPRGMVRFWVRDNGAGSLA